MFIDDLAFLLFVLGFTGVLTLYMTVSVAYNYLKLKHRKVDIYQIVNGGTLPLGALGIYLFIVALWGQFTWPLPGSFNILFFDPLIALSLVLIGFAWSIHTKTKMHYVGLLAMLVGFMTIDYGITGYAIGLTESPIAFMGLFVAFGLAGVFAFPVTLIMDLKPGDESKHSKFWVAMLALFWLFLIIATVLAFTIASLALYPHLSSPP